MYLEVRVRAVSQSLIWSSVLVAALAGAGEVRPCYSAEL